ncbi:ATP-dependent protease ATPase subunit HslU [Treponema sp. OMZ 840]|uniref:ATP-dependent protease ATPase subunit HslU n=1 Tax=Treponema sp. OMZ 840 TaxID=244313 RepID=UPI003D8C6F2E
MKEGLEDLTPKQIVEQLDTYIIGQKKAKRSVAVALRNRTRRLKLPEDIREEIAPKNILMIGPTGVGKTEIARRLAKLCGAPFIKVEATKYTEVGYVGRDVESMVRDLMAVGYNMVKAEMQEQLKAAAGEKVEEDLLDLLLPGSGKKHKKSAKEPKSEGGGFMLPFNIFGSPVSQEKESEPETSEKRGGVQLTDSSAETAGTEGEAAPDVSGEKDGSMSATREKFRTMLREGKLEGREIEITVQKKQRMPSMEIIAGGSPEDMESVMQNISSMLNGSRTKKRSVTVAEARQILLEEHLDRMTDPDKAADAARERVEQMGIIFIDEIDKIAVEGHGNGANVSREGVQRDILPIVEGSSVNTKYGVVDTTHILFIAAGAFNLSKPSDLIPELQGRFPLRVELDSLNAEDFERILTEPKNALTRQYTELLATEDVHIVFKPEAITRMSTLAADTNSRMENIGARRLHTIMETLLEELSFSADEHTGETIEITGEYVDERLKDIVQNQDLSKYIL